MYRAATLVALRDGWIESSDEEKALHLLRYHMEFIKNPATGYAEMWVDGENVESAIRATELGLSMTPIVTCRPLRKVLETKQRAF
jgi:cytidylate kinase